VKFQAAEWARAKRIEKIKTWWVMEAPTGHRFCVIRPQRERFPADLNEWP
jgi:hypothetical protein